MENRLDRLLTPAQERRFVRAWRHGVYSWDLAERFGIPRTSVFTLARRFRLLGYKATVRCKHKARNHG